MELVKINTLETVEAMVSLLSVCQIRKIKKWVVHKSMEKIRENFFVSSINCFPNMLLKTCKTHYAHNELVHFICSLRREKQSKLCSNRQKFAKMYCVKLCIVMIQV